MKFLQLRQAFEVALGAGKATASEPEPKLEPRTIPLYDPDKHKRSKELVAGGDIHWKPVNKMAAMVIAKAPWWAKPWWAKAEYGNENTQAGPSLLPRPETKPNRAQPVEIRSHRRGRKKGKIRPAQAPQPNRQSQPETNALIPSPQKAMEMLYRGQISARQMAAWYP